MITEVKIEDVEKSFKKLAFNKRMDASKGGSWWEDYSKEEIDDYRDLLSPNLTDDWTALLGAATVGDQENGKFKPQWAAFIIRGIKQDAILLEDVYKYSEYIDIFMKNKNRFTEKDLGQYKNQGDFSYWRSMVLKIKEEQDDDPSKQKGISKSEKYKGLLVKQTNNYSLYKIPQQDDMEKENNFYYNASCELGSGTEWCTATGNTPSYFNQYTKEGPLYIFTPTEGGARKYQYSPATGDFMDKDDFRVESGDPIFKTLFPLFEFIDEDYEGGIDTALKMVMEYDPNDVKDDFTYYFNNDISETAGILYEDFWDDYLTEAADGNWDNVKLVQDFFKSEQLDPYNVNSWLRILLKGPKTYNQLVGGGRDYLGQIHLALDEGLQRLGFYGISYNNSKPYLEVFYEYVIKEALFDFLEGNTIRFEYEGQLQKILSKS